MLSVSYNLDLKSKSRQVLNKTKKTKYLALFESRCGSDGARYFLSLGVLLGDLADGF